MKAYVSQILIIIGVLIVIYIFWGADIKIFLKERGVEDIPTFIKFVYSFGLWLTTKFLSIVKGGAEYILELFKNILSNIEKIADLLTGILDILKKISSFVKNL